MIEEIARRARCRTTENDKWGRKEHIKESNSGTIKDTIKIRLYMWEFKANYGRKGLGNRSPMFHQKRIPQNMSWNKKGDKKFNLNDQRGKEWEEIVEIYRISKENRSIDNIGEKQNMLEEQKKREESRRRKNLERDKRRQRSDKKKISEKYAEELNDIR